MFTPCLKRSETVEATPDYPRGSVYSGCRFFLLRRVLRRQNRRARSIADRSPCAACTNAGCNADRGICRGRRVSRRRNVDSRNDAAGSRHDGAFDRIRTNNRVGSDNRTRADDDRTRADDDRARADDDRASADDNARNIDIARSDDTTRIDGAHPFLPHGLERSYLHGAGIRAQKLRMRR